MTTSFQRELEALSNQFHTLCGKVEETVIVAVRAFIEKNAQQVEAIIERDKEIDQMEIEVEETCLELIARFQPVAGDLRYIVAILKMNNDLERIGDLAVNFAKKIKHIPSSGPDHLDTFYLPEMSEKVLKMLKNCIDAVMHFDKDLALSVCKMDDEVDNLKREMKARIIEAIRDNPDQTEYWLSLLINSRHLERIADLTTNISEDVVYMTDGAIIRHQFGKSAAKV